MNEILIKLKKSKFRSSFKLSDNDKKYIEDKGIEKIKEHAYDFVKNRLASKNLKNDGKQTPMHGHPVLLHNTQQQRVVGDVYINGITFKRIII